MRNLRINTENLYYFWVYRNSSWSTDSNNLKVFLRWRYSPETTSRCFENKHARRQIDNEFNERIMQDLTSQEKYLFLSSGSQSSNWKFTVYPVLPVFPLSMIIFYYFYLYVIYYNLQDTISSRNNQFCVIRSVNKMEKC